MKVLPNPVMICLLVMRCALNRNLITVQGELLERNARSTATEDLDQSFQVFDCPSNMVYGNCTCQPTCDDPSGNTKCFDHDCIVAETCICAEGFLQKDSDCVIPSDCGCFVSEYNSVIPV
ncbi:hypothetical protein HOLleu_24268 [Holothuria leucospilota]|uniref:TIL domain-containing protein n=1 Tax=Holothuria leucospilota TaxID=206669 RepID=A0A9Q1BWG0_HOLLE|nr:hypothetical protein HOLleu_24268 [Holothuria leucospilota]